MSQKFENLYFGEANHLKTKRLSQTYVIISLLCFIFLWTIVTDAWHYSTYFFPHNPSLGAYIYAIISRAIWVIPAIILLVLFSNSLSIAPKKLLTNLSHSKLFYIIICLSAVYCATSMFIVHGGFWFNAKESIIWLLVKMLTVGIVEETVYRGWGYNALASLTSSKKAIAISTGLFVILHWPAYFIGLILTGSFSWSGILSQSGVAIIWGIIGCNLLKKDQSIWSPILAHSFYDFIITMFVG